MPSVLVSPEVPEVPAPSSTSKPSTPLAATAIALPRRPLERLKAVLKNRFLGFGSRTAERYIEDYETSGLRPCRTQWGAPCHDRTGSVIDTLARDKPDLFAIVTSV